MALSPHFRRYTRPGWELTRGRPDWREQIDIGAERPALPTGPGAPPWARLQGPNQWPAALPDLKPAALGWLDAASRVAIRLLQAFALALGQPEDAFAPIYARDPNLLIKLNRYPGAPPAFPDDIEVRPIDQVGRHAEVDDILVPLRRPAAIVNPTPPPPPVEPPADPDEADLGITLHIARHGDRSFPAQGWVGNVGRRIQIEAFSISPRGKYSPDELEYKAFGPQGRETQWTTNGKLCGTRGRGLPLTGFAEKPLPHVRDRFDVIYRGAFFDSGITEPCRNGEPCRPARVDDVLEAINLRVVERGRSIAATTGTAVDEASGFIDPAATEATTGTVLNVGCGYPLRRRLHPSFHGPEWRQVRLDINPAVQPDILCSITDMSPVRMRAWTRSGRHTIWNICIVIGANRAWRIRTGAAAGWEAAADAPGSAVRGGTGGEGSISWRRRPTRRQRSDHATGYNLRAWGVAGAGGSFHGAQVRVHSDDVAGVAGGGWVCGG